MTDTVSIVAAALVLLLGLLFFESRETTWGKLVTKTPLSMLFVAAVLVQPHPNQLYFHFIFLGLLFCLGGDVFLALKSDQAFKKGLMSFLIGHVFYIPAFISISDPETWISWRALFVVGFSGIVFFYLRPNLGRMTLPVLAYVTVISLMLIGALSLLFAEGLPPVGRAVIFIGALLFYLSDLFVARDRFIKKEMLNRYIGLPMYYAGQFLLAFSVGMVAEMPVIG